MALPAISGFCVMQPPLPIYGSSSYPLKREKKKGAVPPIFNTPGVMSHPPHADSWFFMSHRRCGILRSDLRSKCLLSSRKHSTGKGCRLKAQSAATQCAKHRNMKDVKKKKTKKNST